MCKWFNKNNKNGVDENKTKQAGNYEIRENGDIKIIIEKHISYYTHYPHTEDVLIPKSSIVSLTQNSIVFKDYRYWYNFEHRFCDIYYKEIDEAIERKQSFIKYKETQLKTYEYSKKDKCWKMVCTEVVGTEIEYEKTPFELFKNEFKSIYKLIETEEEFNAYLSSSLDCDTWCRKKLYDKMKELKLGDGFINQFSDLIGNDLDKYHAMIDLANEVSDKDTLMCLYAYKFGKK